MAGKGGGAWKVAYADFVTAMMAFFMVMWITAQNQEIKESIAHHFSDPFGANDRNGKSGGVNSSGPPFRTDENERISFKPKLMVEQNDRLFQLGTIVYFSDTSTALTDEGKIGLDALIPSLKWEGGEIEIIGFSDKSSIEAMGPKHWALAHERCLAVKDYIGSFGIPDDKIKMIQGIDAEDPESKPMQQPGSAALDRVEVRVPRKHLLE